MFKYQDIRTVLRRSITWTIGYNLYKTWENDIIMIMDDPGGAQNAWLEHWQYPTLTEDQIEKYLIKPLQDTSMPCSISILCRVLSMKKQGDWNRPGPGILPMNSGPDRTISPGKRGYDKGVKLGVFEVLCHGLTHMQPDLVSDPGWYGASLDQEKAEVGWYREFGDTRRQKEIPAAEQLWRMKTGKQWLIEQFGVTPLQFCAGGNGTSISYFNNTFKLAAQAGFGWCGWKEGYCGTDMVIIGWDFMGSSESPSDYSSSPKCPRFWDRNEPGRIRNGFQPVP